MAARHNVATPDRHSRLLLAAVVGVALAVFVWLLAGLVDAAFA